jgi:hypothetical protein
MNKYAAVAANKYGAIAAIVMFTLCAAAGHSMTGQAPMNFAVGDAPISAIELMRTAPVKPEQTSYDAV